MLNSADLLCGKIHYFARVFAAAVAFSVIRTLQTQTCAKQSTPSFATWVQRQSQIIFRDSQKLFFWEYIFVALTNEQVFVIQGRNNTLFGARIDELFRCIRRTHGQDFTDFRCLRSILCTTTISLCGFDAHLAQSHASAMADWIECMDQSGLWLFQGKVQCKAVIL